LGQPEICGYVTEISHCTNQKGKRTFQRYADEVNACLCVFIRRQLLILDEPTSGLDPVSRDELLKILSEYIEDGEHSVLFSTHITGDLERAADYITYISYGELYFTGSKDDFVDMFRIVKRWN